jgi:hypothetical protein
VRACGGLLLLASACGGSVDSNTERESIEAPVVRIAPRVYSADPSKPDPDVIDPNAAADPKLQGLPSSVASIVSDPPDALEVDQFEALLGYYCVSCHATPPCEAACDGFWFNDWPELAAGGNHSPEDAERMLSRTVARLSEGSMPPPSVDEKRQLDQNTRVLMSDFVTEALER